MFRLVIPFFLALGLFAGVASAQGGLNVTVTPDTITSGEPCENVTVKVCNLAAGRSYEFTFQLVDSSGVPVPGYTLVVSGTADAQGCFSVTACIEIAPGQYRVNVTAATSGQTLTGSARLTSH